MSVNKKRWIISLVIYGFCANVYGGSVLTLRTTEYTGRPPILGTVEMATEGNDLRLEITSISSSESGGLIFDGDANAIVALDHANKEYYVIDRPLIDVLAARIEANAKILEEELAQLPPEERRAARERYEAQMPSKSSGYGRGTLEKTGQVGEFAGYECDYYDVHDGGRKIREICVTYWSDFPESQEVAGAMIALGHFFKNMTEAFARSGGFDLMGGQQDMFSYMEEVGGYPVLRRDFDEAGAVKAESILESASQSDLAEARFQPPAGYRQIPLQ